MAKAQITLVNGTNITVDGTVEEIKHLLDYYGGHTTTKHLTDEAPSRKKGIRPETPIEKPLKPKSGDNIDVPLADIVNLVKNCDEAEKIEKQILDRTSLVNRCLLPLYIVHEHMQNVFALTTGEISKITSELGITVQQPNVSHVLTGSASRYVMGNRVRRRGQVVRYKLSRRGLKYLKAVIEGEKNGE